jgi:hypothetical protein
MYARASRRIFLNSSTDTFVSTGWPVVSKWGLGRHLGVSFSFSTTSLLSPLMLPSLCVYRRMTILVRMHQQGSARCLTYTFSRHIKKRSDFAKRHTQMYSSPSHPCIASQIRTETFYFVFSISFLNPTLHGALWSFSRVKTVSVGLSVGVYSLVVLCTHGCWMNLCIK